MAAELRRLPRPPTLGDSARPCYGRGSCKVTATAGSEISLNRAELGMRVACTCALHPEGLVVRACRRCIPCMLPLLASTSVGLEQIATPRWPAVTCTLP